LSLVRKSGVVPKKVEGSARVASDKLFSFAAEGCFLRSLGRQLSLGRLLYAPVAWRAEHDAHSRSFDLLMSDLREDFPRREVALDLEDAKLALAWLALLHGRHVGCSPTGLWEQGTYWNVAKKGEPSLERMEAHWRLARRSLAGFTQISNSLPARLHAASASLDRAIHSTSSASTPSAAATPKRRRMTRHERPPPRALLHTLVHGDYKAENLFFRARHAHVSGGDGPDGAAPDRCAACDFQWAGRGVGACDVIYLLTTSLADGLLRASEAELLAHYNAALLRERAAADAPRAPDASGRHGQADRTDMVGHAEGSAGASSAARDADAATYPLAEFEHEYALALLDFARFVLADAPLVEGDDWLCERADALLVRLERAVGSPLTTSLSAGAACDVALAARPGPFVGSLPLTGA
jgi:hypothetical protein